jgi:hypothetical protein
MLHRMTILQTRDARPTRLVQDDYASPLDRLYYEMVRFTPQPKVRTQSLPVMVSAVPAGRGFRGVR